MNQKEALLAKYHSSHEILSDLIQVVNEYMVDVNGQNLQVSKNTLGDCIPDRIRNLVELLDDLQSYSQYVRDQDFESIKKFGLEYINKHLIKSYYNFEE